MEVVPARKSICLYITITYFCSLTVLHAMDGDIDLHSQSSHHCFMDSTSYVTPLMRAANAKDLETVQVLLKSGASLDLRDYYGQSVLHYAVHAGAVAVVDLLLQNGVKVNARDCYGRTPLHSAKSELAGLLLDAGAEIDAATYTQRQTPLMLAAYRGDADLIILLVERGARLELIGALPGRRDICSSVLAFAHAGFLYKDCTEKDRTIMSYLKHAMRQLGFPL